MFNRQRQWCIDHNRDVKIFAAGVAAASFTFLCAQIRKNLNVKVDQVHSFTSKKNNDHIVVTRTTTGHIDIFDMDDFDPTK